MSLNRGRKYVFPPGRILVPGYPPHFVYFVQVSVRQAETYIHSALLGFPSVLPKM